MSAKHCFSLTVLLFVSLILCSDCYSVLKDEPVSAASPDTYLTTPKIIRRHGYPAEAHIIQSEDGYLLEYHRIPHARNATASTQKYPILLHHGLLCSSIDWVINGPGKGLAYLLADAGYDVWLANARGNTYSRSHVNLSPSDRAFWDYSFHEMGVYDVPAAIDYILKVTSARKLIYIGHSLGTTTFYAFATNRPEYSDKILTQISIAPVAAIPHTTSVFRVFVPIAKEIETMMDWYYKGAFLEHDVLTALFCKYLCGRKMFNTNVCEQIVIFNLFGKDEQQFNTTLIPMITSNIPAGTSGKNMLHCAQLISSGGKFRNYDYGSTENMKRYNSVEPPTYNISSISIPMKFFYAKNDILADPMDVEILYQQVKKPLGMVLIDYEQWNHVDYLWAIDVDKYFNNIIMEFVKNITTEPNFIEISIEEAIAERQRNPIQNYTQIYEKDFENKISDAINEIPSSLKVNFEKSFMAMKEGVDKKFTDMGNTISNSFQNSARNINNSFQKTSRTIQIAIQDGVTSAEKSVNASVKQIEQKWKDVLEKLSIVFTP